ncbi:NAD-dependent epimerase/dehydratase family protein [Streptomyces sp. NPDC018031]|uniref:NAD-dependent epimerase/dehydratase family protein n=1 Tax=Streptomyces sp. NPDC018031 TaxID=3365033 RepID=UPI0037932019
MSDNEASHRGAAGRAGDRDRRRIAVIGGTRYFGRHLVRRLHEAGHQVTVINRGSTAPPPGAGLLVADRDDERALAGALGSRDFDTVIDQVCYTPAQAAVAARVFGGRTARYVMTSTIEVYDPATGAPAPAGPAAPLPEGTVDPLTWPVRPELPWHDADFREARYAEGKRQAEAVLAGAFAARGVPFVTVRSAHVLGGGAREFTGRLEHYVRRVRDGADIAVHRRVRPTVFIHHDEIADLLRWAALGDFTGPVNACSHGLLDVYALGATIADRTGRRPRYRTVGADASPFSFDRFYAMSNARAERLGFRFSHTSDWLPEAVTDTLTAMAR